MLCSPHFFSYRTKNAVLEIYAPKRDVVEASRAESDAAIKQLDAAKDQFERLEQNEYTAKQAAEISLHSASELAASQAIENLINVQTAAIAAKAALNTAYVRMTTTKRTWKLLLLQLTKEYTDFLRETDEEWLVNAPFLPFLYIKINIHLHEADGYQNVDFSG